MSYELKIVVAHTPELEELIKKHTKIPCVDLYAKNSYFSVLMPCEDEKEFDRICEDDSFAEQKLYEATCLM